MYPKNLEKLEYNKVLKILSSFAITEVGKNTSMPGIFAASFIGPQPRPFSCTPAKQSRTRFDGASAPHSTFDEMPINEAAAEPLMNARRVPEILLMFNSYGFFSLGLLLKRCHYIPLSGSMAIPEKYSVFK